MALRAEPFKLEDSIVTNFNKNSNDEMTKYLKRMGVKGKAVNIGSVQFSTSREWQKFGGHPKSFGKADITVGKSNISIKSTDNHLIFSGAKGESKALFLSVANKYNKKKLAVVVDNVIKSLDDMVGSSITSSKISQAKKSDKIIQQAGLIHESIKLEIIDMFTNDKNYSRMIIKEMLSGELKFKGEGSAQYILYPEPKLISIDSPEIFKNNSIDIRVDFKSQSAPCSGNVGNYRFWSVIQLIQKRLWLDEDISVIQNIHRYIRALFDTIKQFLLDDWGDFLNFLELELEITEIEK